MVRNFQFVFQSTNRRTHCPHNERDILIMPEAKPNAVFTILSSTLHGFCLKGANVLSATTNILCVPVTHKVQTWVGHNFLS